MLNRLIAAMRLDRAKRIELLLKVYHMALSAMRKIEDLLLAPRMIGNHFLRKSLRRYTSHPFVVFIAHSDIYTSLGGTEKYQLGEIAELQRNGIAVFQVFPYILENRARKYGINVDGEYFREIRFRQLLRIIGYLNGCSTLLSYNIHHLANWMNHHVELVLDRIKTRPIFAYFHDISFLCIDAFAMMSGRKRCEIALNLGSAVCDHCRSSDALTARRALYTKLVSISRRVFTPSEFMEGLILSRYPNVRTKLVISEHVSLEIEGKKLSREQPKVKIAFLGYRAPHKGWDVFRQIASDPELREMYEFVHIGSLDKNDKDGVGIGVVEYSYRNGENEAKDKLIANGIDIAFVWSTIPESYSYTAHEAHAAGVPILAYYRSGNVSDKIQRRLVYGRVFRSTEELRDFLLDASDVRSFLDGGPDDWVRRIRHNSCYMQYLRAAELR